MSSHLERARMLMDVRRHRDAAPLILEQLALEPNSAYAHAMLARCYLAMKQFQDARKQAEEAIHLQPDYGYAHYIHSFVLRDLKRPNDARDAIRDALRLEPANADYLSQSADLFNLQEKYDDAIRDAERGLAIDPMNVECACDRAFALMCQQKYAQAEAALKEILAAHPDQARIHATIGWVAVNCRKYRLAQQYFAEALRIEPENKWAVEGMEEAELGGSGWRFLAGLDAAAPESVISALGTLLLLVIAYYCIWSPPWLQPPPRLGARTPRDPMLDAGAFTLVGAWALCLMCGSILAKLRFAFSRSTRARLTTWELWAIVGGWCLPVLGAAILFAANHQQSRAAYAAGCVLLWGTVPLVNIVRFRTRTVGWLFASCAMLYFATGIGVVLSFQFGELTTDKIWLQIAVWHWFLAASFPFSLWMLTLYESEPEGK